MIFQNLESIYGASSNPIYIYSPPWTSASAGIRALHYLCHALNSSGYNSFLVLASKPIRGKSPVNGRLNTPVLSDDIAAQHFYEKLTPITVYSETIPGNPLKSPAVVRYLMNFIGELGGPIRFTENEYLISYSRAISLDYLSKTGSEVNFELFLPAIDPREFTPADPSEKKDFYLVYAGKYRAFYGEPPKIDKSNIIEIRRDGKIAQPRSKVIQLLREARAVISFDNSSIITEAVLSGTPGLFYPNPSLSRPIAEHELGWGGTGWGISALDEIKASQSLLEGRETYLESIGRFHSNLHLCFNEILDRFSTYKSEQPLRVPNHRFLVNRHRIYLADQIIRNLGFKSFLRVLRNFVKRRFSRRY